MVSFNFWVNYRFNICPWIPFKTGLFNPVFRSETIFTSTFGKVLAEIHIRSLSLPGKLSWEYWWWVVLYSRVYLWVYFPPTFSPNWLWCKLKAVGYFFLNGTSLLIYFAPAFPFDRKYINTGKEDCVCLWAFKA